MKDNESHALISPMLAKRPFLPSFPKMELEKKVTDLDGLQKHGLCGSIEPPLLTFLFWTGSFSLALDGLRRNMVLPPERINQSIQPNSGRG